MGTDKGINIIITLYGAYHEGNDELSILDQQDSHFFNYPNKAQKQMNKINWFT